MKRCGVIRIRVKLGGAEAAAHGELIDLPTSSWAAESGTCPNVWFLVIHVAPRRDDVHCLIACVFVFRIVQKEYLRV